MESSAKNMAAVCALTWFRTDNTKLLCFEHETVQLITVVDSVAKQGEQTLYRVKLACGCHRDLLYRKITSTSGYQLVKTKKVEVVKVEAA